MNQIYELKELQPNNRGLFALKDLKTGFKIMQSQPLAWATIKKLKGDICNWCLLKKQLFRCSQCKCFYYCSQDCQKKDWTIHKHQCKVFQQMTNVKKLSVHKEMASQFVLNLRIAILLKIDPAFSKIFFDHISLQDHQQLDKLQYFQEMAVVLLQNLGEPKTQENLSKMMRQLNIVSANAFTIQDFLCQTDGVAIGFFSPSSYINHDCQPNSTQYFDGRYLTVITNREIKAKEEITISYTNPLALLEERRDFLRKNYLFECFCQLCQVEQLVNTKYHYILCPHCHHKLSKKASEENQTQKEFYQCEGCSKKFSLLQMGQLLKRIHKEMQQFGKQEQHGALKKKLFSLKKILSMDHPFYGGALDKVYHATINLLTSVVEDQDKHNKLLQQAYILVKQQIKGIPKWYKLGEGQEKNIRFFLKYAQMGKLCYNLFKYQKALEYTELAMTIVKDYTVKNKYPQVDQLRMRFQQLRVEVSMAKAKSFNSS